MRSPRVTMPMHRLAARLMLATAVAAGPLQLHLGCNTVDFGPDWVHIDAAHHAHVSSHDVKTLPFADGAASIVYSSHMFEYFDRDEAKEVLAEWFRVLMPGGTVRIAVPDFEAVASAPR